MWPRVGVSPLRHRPRHSEIDPGRVTAVPPGGFIADIVATSPICRSQVAASAVLCGRRIFAERFGDAVLPPSARRMARLDVVVHHLGLALGGRPAASITRRLMVPVSNDTLLRVVRRLCRLRSNRLDVIGINDWAWRRNHSYETIVCDLERRRPVTLLRDREQATTAAWLAEQQKITVIARDRSGGYGEAALALPPRQPI